MREHTMRPMLTTRQQCLKRCFDIVVALPLVLLLLPVVVALVCIATIDTGSFGLFVQTRIGQHGRPFKLFKVRTMRATQSSNTVTVAGDSRITTCGGILRRLKLDELPQFWNVLFGTLSLVGPRPDVPGFADELSGDDRVLLQIRPGITGPSSLRWRKEERLLEQVADPIAFNRDTVWPDKVRCNLEYMQQWSLGLDVRLLAATAFPGSVKTVWPAIQSAEELV